VENPEINRRHFGKLKGRSRFGRELTPFGPNLPALILHRNEGDRFHGQFGGTDADVPALKYSTV
jgi:hypothetical protein